MWIKAKHWYLQDNFKNEDDRQAARILFVLILASLVPCLITLAASFYWDDLRLSIVILVGCVLLTMSLGLLIRGHVRASSYSMELIALGIVTLSATLGQGIYDIAIITYPVIILFASLMFDRRGFGLISGLAVASIGWLVFGEINGLFVPMPEGTAEWPDFLIIGSILCITALTSYLLATNMRGGLSQARQELAERKRAEEALRESEAIFASFLEHSPIYIFFKDKELRALRLSRNYEQMLGIPAHQALGKTMDELFPSALAKSMMADDLRILDEGKPVEVVEEFGDRIYETTKFPIFKDDKPHILAGFTIDITERHRAAEALQESEQQQKTIFDVVQAGILLLDAETHTIVDVNPSAAKMIGIPREQLFGTVCHKHFCPAEVGRCPITDLGQSLDDSERILLTANGGKLSIIKSVVSVTIRGRKHLIESFIDITERKRAEEQLRYLGTHDALTGIHNRTFFEAELARLEHSREFPISIVIADLDNMKKTNDTLGHSVGDGLLKRAADVFQSVFRTSDILARIGGDEFAILLPNTDTATAKQLSKRVDEKLNEHNVQHPDVPVQLSLGVATAEKDRLVEAFTLADQRMYMDKSTHKSDVND